MSAPAQELATVYLSVVPSFEGVEGNLGALFGAPLEKSAAKAGDDAGKGFSDKFSTSAKAGMAVAGVAIGAAVVAGFGSAIEKDSANNKLTAQLALSPEESARMGKLSGELYANNYGDSMGQVNDALKSVTQNIGGLEGVSDEALGGITKKVLSTANAFDQDLTSVTTAAGILMKNGLAKDADEALDVITRGLQTNGGAADDMLDSFSEYAPIFQSLGVDGATGLGLINQSMAAGALNTDVASDALKEFAIRSKDGSTASADAYKAMGLNAEEMTAQMAKGGPEAAAGMQTVMDKLKAMTDPVEKNTAAVALFGGKGEDLSKVLMAFDPKTAVGALGEVAGAAGKVDEQLGKGTGPALETLKRGMEGAFGGLVTSVLPVLEPVIGFLTQFAPVLGPVALALGAVAAAQWAWNIAQLANPMTWIILGIIALVAGIVWLIANWDTAVTFLLALWAPIGDFFSNLWEGIVFGAGLAWEGFKKLIAVAWQAIVWVFQNLYLPGIILSHWDEITAFTNTIWNAMIGFFGGIWASIVENVSRGIGEVVDWFSGMVDDITGFFSGLIDDAKEFGGNIVQGIIDGVRGMASNLMKVFGDVMPDWIKGPFAAALGINSPSRVFMEMGKNTGEGFVIGADSQEAAIKKSMIEIAQVPAMPRSSYAPANVGVGVGVGDTFNTTVNPSKGMDEKELADLVARQQQRKRRR